MTSPYKNQLLEYLNVDNEVTVDRDGAPSVAGRVIQVGDDACVIKGDGDEKAGTRRHYFIAYENIRGVSTLEYSRD